MADCPLYLPGSAAPPSGRTMKLLLETVRRSMWSVSVMPMRLVVAWSVALFFGETMLTAGAPVIGAVWCGMIALPLPWSLPTSTRLPNTVPKSSSRPLMLDVPVPEIAPVARSTFAYWTEKPACAKPRCVDT